MNEFRSLMALPLDHDNWHSGWNIVHRLASMFAFRSSGTRINPDFKTVKSGKTINISSLLDFAVLMRTKWTYALALYLEKPIRFRYTLL